MSSKRAKLREMKRRKAVQRKWLIASACALAAVIVVAVALAALNSYSQSYVLTFEGRKIATADMRYCSLFTSAADEAQQKEQALDLLLQSLVVQAKADELGVTMTDEEKTAAQTNADNFISSYTSFGTDMSFIAPERAGEIMGQMDNLYTKLLEQFTADYQVDEAAFQTALEDYKENDKLAYYDIQVKFITNTDKTVMDGIKAELDQGADFDTLYAEHTAGYTEETGVQTRPLSQLTLDDAILQSIMDLSVGQYTDVVTLGSDYVIFCVDTYNIPSDDEVAATFRTQYVTGEKNTMFEAIVEEWKQEYDHQVNQKGYDAV